MLKCVIPIGGNLFFPPPHNDVPKILKNISNKPIVHWALEHIETLSDDIEYILVTDDAVEQAYHLHNVIEFYTTRKVSKLILGSPTLGLPPAVLLAMNLIGSGNEVIITSADQFIDINFAYALEEFRSSDASAGVLYFDSMHPKWSYAILDTQGRVQEVQEKNPISHNALTSTYWFRNSDEMYRSIMANIRRGQKVDGRFFLAPCVNELILEGKMVKAVSIANDKYFNFYDSIQLQDFTTYVRDRAFARKSSLINLTRAYAEAFNGKNSPAVEKMLAENVSLSDSYTPEMHGKEHVCQFIRDIFAQHDILEFAPVRIASVSDDTTLIEFSLRLDEDTFAGVDLITWQDDRIQSLTAYLHKLPKQG